MKICPLILSLISAAISYTFATNDTNYCDGTLCGDRPHIGCDHNLEFSVNCPADAKFVDINADLQKFLLDTLNKKRDFIAGGGDARYEKACHMATVQWDDELAHLATLNVKQCTKERDACHSTTNFYHSGQNLAQMSYQEPLDNWQQLESAINNWYSEIENCNSFYISRYPAVYREPDFASFATMMTEKNTHVGCAAATFSEPIQPYKVYLVACNFATTTFRNLPIYVACPRAGIACKTGVHSNYTNLCSVAEEYRGLRQAIIYPSFFNLQ